MGKLSVTVIGLWMVLTGWTAVTLAGGMPLEDEADTLEISGTVLHKDMESGFFVIEGDDGRIYDPINLPDSFKRNGLEVKASIILRKDLGGIHMVGDIMEIVDITVE